MTAPKIVSPNTMASRTLSTDSSRSGLYGGPTDRALVSAARFQCGCVVRCAVRISAGHLRGTALVFHFHHRRLEYSPAMLIVVEHVEARAGRSKQDSITGRRDADRPLNGISH